MLIGELRGAAEAMLATHAGCMRDSLVAALAGHGAMMQAAMHQALQAIVAPAAHRLQQVTPATSLPAPAPQFTLAQAKSAVSYPADAAPVAALQLNRQQQYSRQPDVQALASAVHCSDTPLEAVQQQQIDTAEEQVDPTQQQYGGLGKQTSAAVAQAVLHAPQLHASMVSRVPETDPAQLPPPSAPHEAHDSGASATASGAGERPALLTHCRTAKRGSSSFAEAVHPDTASHRDSKRPRHGDTGANLILPSACCDMHWMCTHAVSCHAAAFLRSPCLWALRARDALARREGRVDCRARGVCAQPALRRSSGPAAQAAHASPLQERQRAGALPRSLLIPWTGSLSRPLLHAHAHAHAHQPLQTTVLRTT